MESNFKYQLGTCVEIVVSGEQGNIIARAEYQHAENRYLVRYSSGDRRAVEVWWNESALA